MFLVTCDPKQSPPFLLLRLFLALRQRSLRQTERVGFLIKRWDSFVQFFYLGIWLSFPLFLWCSFEIKYAVIRVSKKVLPDPLISSWPLAAPESNPFNIINIVSLLFLYVHVVEVPGASSLVFIGPRCPWSDLWVLMSVRPSKTFCRLNWCDSCWWGYQLNTDW